MIQHKKKKIHTISCGEGNPMKRDKRKDTKENNAAIISNHGRSYYFLSSYFLEIASEDDSMEKRTQRLKDLLSKRLATGDFSSIS